jgi:hypothetical protein
MRVPSTITTAFLTTSFDVPSNIRAAFKAITRCCATAETARQRWSASTASFCMR